MSMYETRFGLTAGVLPGCRTIMGRHTPAFYSVVFEFRKGGP